MTDADELKRLVQAAMDKVLVGQLPTDVELQELIDMVAKTQNKETCDVQPQEADWTWARVLAETLHDLQELRDSFGKPRKLYNYPYPYWR